MSCAESDAPGGPAGGPKARAAGAPRSARRRAREFALQGLYGWLLGGGSADSVAAHMKTLPGYRQADEDYFLELIRGTTGSADGLREQFAGQIDRPLAELSPVEHAILLIATYELAQHPEVPYRVVINEAVELAKAFGGPEGHRYVNGVLDKLAGRIRVHEAADRAGR